MAKQTNSSEIKKILKAGGVILGTQRTLKSLKVGSVKKVLMSSNCPASVEKAIMHYSALSGSESEKLKYTNDDLGVICKKPFSISVLGILKV